MDRSWIRIKEKNKRCWGTDRSLSRIRVKARIKRSLTGEGVRLEFGPNLGWIGMNEFKITLVEIYNSGKSMKCWGIN